MRRALYCLARYCAFTVVSPFKLLSRRSLHMPKESLSSARLDFGSYRFRYIATSHFYAGRFLRFREGH